MVRPPDAQERWRAVVRRPDALGSFIDVFDPARARADRDLESHKNTGEVLPSPDEDEDDGHPHWTLDLHRGEVRIRPARPRITPP